jgi:type I restriction enzyme S subunit
MDGLCDITSSKRIFAADYVSEGVPFYRGREITEKFRGNLDVSTELFITEEKFAEIEHKFGAPLPGDLLLTSVGTLGSVYVVKLGERFYFKDGNLTWFRHFKHLDSRFLFYWLIAPQGKAQLQRCTIGVAQPALTIVHLKGMEIELPPLPVQRRIAGILSNYDELIENNQRRIKILDEMARSLYREWFVHFRFPGHDKVKMVPSPLGPIPQGWEVKSLAELMEIRGGSQPPKSEFVYAEQPGYVRLIQIRDYETDCHLTFVRESSNLRLCNRTDIMIARYGASVARICWGLMGAYNVALIKVIPLITNCQEYLRQCLSDEEFQKLLIGMSGRAAQNGFNKSDIAAIRVPFPNSHSLLKRFEQFTVPLRDTILMLRDQTENLRRTHDLLLPRLLSGQIDLKSMDAIA